MSDVSLPQDAQEQAPNLQVDSQRLRSSSSSFCELTTLTNESTQMLKTNAFNTLWNNMDQSFKTNYNRALGNPVNIKKVDQKIGFLNNVCL